MAAAQKPHDDNAITKLCCQLGLIVSWFVGVSALVGGGICLYLQLRDGNSVFFVTSREWRELIPLILNVIVTLLNDSMGYIHSCSLRWALQREHKLDFNSNLRLLSNSRQSKPNAWYSNLLYLFGIVLSYSSTSLIFLSLDPQLENVLKESVSTSSRNPNEIHINAIALLAIGVGLLSQAIVTNWAFVASHIPTWSSNPLDVVKECLDENNGFRIHHRQGRCMMSVHLAKEDRGHHRPTPRQRPMISAHRQVRWVFFLHWILPVLGGLWGAIIYVMIIKGDRNGVLGRSWSFLPIFTGYTDTACSAHSCTDGTSILNIGWTAYSGPMESTGSVFLITGFQAIVTLSLHCAELIVNLSRDEGVYRKLIGPRGTNGHYNSIIAACTSWQTIFLFCLKAGVHWMFGLAINVSFGLGVNMYPPQIFYFTAFTLLAALFSTYLAFRRPSGHLPASYGHIQTIADVIDEWQDSGSMFWGHKADGSPCYAGTSHKKLPQPREDRHYGGNDRLTPEEQAYRIGYAAASRDQLGRVSPSPYPSPLTPESANAAGGGGYNWNRPSMGSLNSMYSSQSNQPLMYGRY